jgi:predicted esterase
MFARGLVVLFCAVSAVGATLQHETTTFQSGGRKVAMEEYAPHSATSDTAAVILLCGSGGSQSPAISYSGQARFFTLSGRRVYLPHYLDVTHRSPGQPELQYGVWAETVRDAIRTIQSKTRLQPSRTVLVGYSLGASVALAVAALGFRFAGVVVWSGSLPDVYRDMDKLPPLLILHGGRDEVIPEFNALQLAGLCRLKHFRCDLNIFPEEGHAFSADGIKRADQQILAFLDAVLPVH